MTLNNFQGHCTYYAMCRMQFKLSQTEMVVA